MLITDKSLLAPLQGRGGGTEILESNTGFPNS